MYATIFWYIMTRVQVPSKEYLVCFLKTVARSPLIGVRKTHTHTWKHLFQSQSPASLPATSTIQKNPCNYTTPTILPAIPFASPSHTPWSSEPKINAQLLPSGETCKIFSTTLLTSWFNEMKPFTFSCVRFINDSYRWNWGIIEVVVAANINKQQTTNNKYMFIYIYI